MKLVIDFSVDDQPLHRAALTLGPESEMPKRAPVPDWLAALDFSLTQREAEVVKLVATGMSYRQAALRLGISEKTVRGHMSAIFIRTGVQSNTMLVAWAWLSGLISEADVIDAWKTIAPHLVQIA